MLTQSELIGNHPTDEIFAKWLLCNDIPISSTKKHRSLTPLISNDNGDLVEWLGKKIFLHHHSDYRIQKLRENYLKLGYSKYAEQHSKLPKSDKTKKGNATEILLTEYVQCCLKKELIKVFKLKYNPNVDQAIKGDDTLMVDLIKTEEEEKVKLYLGEAKFRKVPSKNVVEIISKSLCKDKKPISYSFLIDELGRNEETRSLADTLDKFIVDEIKGKGDIVYTGFLLSDTSAFQTVELHLKSNNPYMVMITVGIEDPEQLISKAFQLAQFFINNPDKL